MPAVRPAGLGSWLHSGGPHVPTDRAVGGGGGGGAVQAHAPAGAAPARFGGPGDGPGGGHAAGCVQVGVMRTRGPRSVPWPTVHAPPQHRARVQDTRLTGRETPSHL